MVAVGPLDKQAMIKRISSINPKGMTPITRSLEKAGAVLAAAESYTTIILVSDGKETCKGDPCAAMKGLREKGIQVTAHVVGFDVTDEEKKQLTCIAEQGGGRYFTAGNAEELKGALKEVLEDAASNTRIGAIIKGQDGAPVLGYVSVFRVEDGENKLVVNGRCFKEPCVFNVAPGEYMLRVRNHKTGDMTTFKDIVLTEGQEIIKTVSLAARLGGYITGFKGRDIPGYIHVHRQIDGKYKQIANAQVSKEPNMFEVQPGTYKLKIINKHSGQSVEFADIVVAPGQEVVKHAAFSARLGGMIKGFQAKPVPGYIQLHLCTGKRTRPVANATCQDAVVYDVLPGTYTLRLINRGSGVPVEFADLVLEPGTEIIKQAAMGGRLGGIGKDAQGNPIGFIFIVKEVTEGKERHLMNKPGKDKPLVFDFPPGTYTIIIQNRATAEKKRFENLVLRDGQEMIQEAVFK